MLVPMGPYLLLLPLRPWDGSALQPDYLVWWVRYAGPPFHR